MTPARHSDTNTSADEAMRNFTKMKVVSSVIKLLRETFLYSGNGTTRIRYGLVTIFVARSGVAAALTLHHTPLASSILDHLRAHFWSTMYVNATNVEVSANLEDA